MYRSIVPDVLLKFGIEDFELADAQKGYRNESYAVTLPDMSVINLIFFKREPGILLRVKRADYTASIARADGLPVRTRHDPRLMRVSDGLYAGLYDYLPGRTVPWEAMTMKHIKLLGYAMGDLHTTLARSSPADAFTIADELLPLISRMRRYFASADVNQAMNEKLGVRLEVNFDDYERLVSKSGSLAGQQPLHMDMVRGNVLFADASPNDTWQLDGLALTGVIDFEKVAYGSPAFDIARTLAFLLVDSPKPAEKVYKYFLDSGYHKHAGRPLPDPWLLTPLIWLFAIYDFYKFLRHTPYESLRDNYHYGRTLTLLQTYGMIGKTSEGESRELEKASYRAE